MEGLGKNRFWDQLFSFKRIKKRLGTIGKIFNHETKEVMDAEFVGATHEVLIDRDPFVKLYDGAFESLPKMTYVAIKIFSYLGRNLSVNHDFIVLNPASVMEAMDIGTKAEFYQGVKNLKELNIITGTRIGMVYHLNPLMFYSGDRTEGMKLHLGETSETLAGWEDWAGQVIGKMEAEAFTTGYAKGVQAGYDTPMVQEDEETYWERATDELQELPNLFIPAR